jgi:hypothetical protein
MTGMLATPGNENTPVQRHRSFNNLRIFSEEANCAVRGVADFGALSRLTAI